MALVNMKEMLSDARKAHRAVGAFNIANYELSRAVLQAAEAENEPVIIQLYMRLFDSEKNKRVCICSGLCGSGRRGVCNFKA